MKIGILTFHEASNFGALLQSYALQQALLKLGAEPQFVNIRRKAQGQAPVVSPFAKRIQDMKEKRDSLFRAFQEKYLKQSPLFEMNDDIDSAFDAFIAGSDQVWNLSIPEVDARYFLPFAKPEKRFSYAASFGSSSVPESSREWISKQLSLFKEITVREENGKALVKNLTGKDAKVCVDPVFLLDRDQWKAIADADKEASEQSYLLLFLLQYDPAFVQMAQQAAKDKNLALKVVTAGFMPQLGFDAWTNTSVNRWVSLISNTEHVYSDSFHAMAFSLMFGRKLNRKPLGGDLAKRNGRTEELLALMGLETDPSKTIQADGDLVMEKLSQRRASSFDYLKGIVNNAN